MKGLNKETFCNLAVDEVVDEGCVGVTSCKNFEFEVFAKALCINKQRPKNPSCLLSFVLFQTKFKFQILFDHTCK